jgi:sulfite exporter TauE/SafE
MTENFTLIFSLINLGFFGGFTHCVGMCGPFVLTQVGENLRKTPLEKFSTFNRLKNLALLPYHLGRICTYAIIGFCCSFFNKNIQDFFGFKIFSAIFLLLAASVFLNIFFKERVFKANLPFKLPKITIVTAFFSKKISALLAILFQNPRGFSGFFLGLILGFIPCGLLYGAFLIVSVFDNPFFAALGMIFFGISTFPSLFFTACGGKILSKIPEFKLVSKALILVNIISLVLLAIKLIFKT